MPLKQENRFLGLATSLGPNVLGLRSVSIHEGLSQLFEIEAEISSEDRQVKFDKVVGRKAVVRLELGKAGKRYFNGVVRRLVQVANKGGLAHYRATIVPWLWFLTRTADCRIFQEKTAPEIIEEIFKDKGFSDYKLSLTGTYQKREYCVQYRETAFNFVSRLMEQEGIYYFFEHTQDKHTLVLADAISASKPFPGYEEIQFNEIDSKVSGRQYINDWSLEEEVQPVAYALTDYDFTKPGASLAAGLEVKREHGGAEYEVFDYPGDYREASEGERLASVRLDELQVQRETVRGRGSVRGLAAGSTFTLKGNPREDQNREYLLSSVSLVADAGEFTSDRTAPGEEAFEAAFTAIDVKQAFRPRRIATKPIVQGPQTAIVVGPAGEEIHTDPYARVKVQFHWDRYGKADENSSCWVRVSQAMAGKKWGGVFIPRIGQEVVVDFLEGDPDRPIITGCVYNDESKPPYDLPANKTISAFKSLSSMGGEGFNEIRFEDKAGEEQLFIHAQKSFDLRTGKDRFDTVSNDHHTNVATNSHLSVGANQHQTVGGHSNTSVGADRNLSVGGKSAVDVGGSDSRSVGGAVAESCGGARSMSVSGDLYLSAANVVIEASGNITLKAGGSCLAIEGGGAKLASGGDVQIQGASLDASGSGETKVHGGTVKVNGSGPVDVQGGGPVSVKGAVVQVN